MPKLPKVRPAHGQVLALAAGVGLLDVGLALWSVPLMFVTDGVLLTVGALLYDDGGDA